ncbi:hypothetical protein DV096_16960 [Bradymonadaceae bacterium TMQ3]|nr:hypothetical protein DV096_16960 [Bradymonadaceae bacterium TMQ3]TXC69399.1 AgmX/PglI C-terminal domain-containing protein [Bradymonadales bacterium TMQ1]
MRVLCPTAPFALLTLTLAGALGACQSAPQTTDEAPVEAPRQGALSADADASAAASSGEAKEPSRILHRAMSAAEAEINTCYRRALAQNAELAGMLQFAWQLDETNAPVGLQIHTDTVGDAALSQCVAEALYPHLVDSDARGASSREVILSYSFLREHGAREVQLVLGSGARAEAQRDALPPEAREEGRCNNEHIYDVLYEAHGAINGCYDKALSRTPGLVGAALAQFIIIPDGSTSHIKVASTIADETTNHCITETLSATTFDAPEGGVCTINYPIELSLRSHPHFMFTAPAP